MILPHKNAKGKLYIDANALNWIYYNVQVQLHN
jgi:hypothetical protein